MWACMGHEALFAMVPWRHAGCKTPCGRAWAMMPQLRDPMWACFAVRDHVGMHGPRCSMCSGSLCGMLSCKPSAFGDAPALQGNKKHVTSIHLHKLPHRCHRAAPTCKYELRDAFVDVSKGAKKQKTYLIFLIFCSPKGHTSGVPEHAR